MRIIFKQGDVFVTEFQHTDIPLPRPGDVVITSYFGGEKRYTVKDVEFNFGAEKPIIKVTIY